MKKIRSTIFSKCVAFTLVVSTVLTSCSSGSKTKVSDESRPNIIIILADDLGYSDLGCYGSEIHTPNLDMLASNGMRFTQFYNTSRCCPTRASLLTGLYPHQAGIGQMTMDTGKPGYRGFLTENTVTIAEALKQAGYNTGMTGKWHISQTKELPKEQHLKWLAHQESFGPFGDTAQYPTARGFDKFYGNIWGVVDYFDPFSLVNNKEQVMNVPSNYYHTDAISDSAVAYVDHFSRQRNPFFLYIAHTAPHWPIQALPEDIRKYEDVYNDGWEALRKKRYNKMVKLGLIDSTTAPLSAWMFPNQKWSENKDAKWDAHAMAVHAAMIDRMDQGIGRLILKLKERNELDNTLIMFLSDNGASSENPSRYGPGFDRAGATRDGRAVLFSLEKTDETRPGPQNIHTGISNIWAHAVNTPFRYWKSKIYEGGICTPMIAYWPKGITQQNSITQEMGHVIDFMPTCLDLAHAEYPQKFNGKKITPVEGKSLVPVFKSGKRDDPEYLFWEHFGSKGIRQGKWKLVQLDPQSEWQLFDLDNDRTETKDLAEQNPDVVSSLKLKWEEIAQRTNVYPTPSQN